MKRFIAVILACLMIAGVFAGCAKNNTENEVATDVEMGENVVALAGDYEITMDDINVYVYLLVPYFQQYTGSDEGWEKIVLNDGLTARDALIDSAIKEFRDQLAFVDYAIKEGFYSEADAEADFETFKANVGGDSVLEELAAEYNLNTDVLKKYAAYNGAYSALMENACSDEEADKIYNESYITAKHILVLFEGRDSEEAALKEAEAIYSKAIAGENFENLINTYNEDPGQDVDNGYTFTIGTMVDEFYECAMALSEGEISEPVKTTYGYHIIKKYANPGKESDAYAQVITTIKNTEASNLLTDEMYEEMIADYQLTINESILGTIDLSKYTVETVMDENVNYADGSVFNE